MQAAQWAGLFMAGGCGGVLAAHAGGDGRRTAGGRDLLLCACDVSPQGGEVELSVARDHDRLIISVGDRGAESLPHVPTTADGRGRLDRLVTSEVLRIHRGELDFVARPGGGTCALLRLPADTHAVSEPSRTASA